MQGLLATTSPPVPIPEVPHYQLPSGFYILLQMKSKMSAPIIDMMRPAGWNEEPGVGLENMREQDQPPVAGASFLLSFLLSNFTFLLFKTASGWLHRLVRPRCYATSS